MLLIYGHFSRLSGIPWELSKNALYEISSSLLYKIKHFPTYEIQFGFEIKLHVHCFFGPSVQMNKFKGKSYLKLKEKETQIRFQII